MIMIEKYQSFGRRVHCAIIGQFISSLEVVMLHGLDDFSSNKQAAGSLMTKLGDFPHFPPFPPQRHLSMASCLGDFQPLSMHHVVRNVACLLTKGVHHIRNNLRMSEISGYLEPLSRDLAMSFPSLVD